MNLFEKSSEKIILPHAELIYIKNFLSLKDANYYYKTLNDQTLWRQDTIKIFGKTYNQPRLTAFMGPEGLTYSYSGICMTALPYSETVLKIKAKLQLLAKTTFNAVLLNLYRDGSDSNSWHADNESSLGKNPVIASVSMGAERPFHFKHRTLKSQRHKLLLHHGSLLIMKGEMQHHWLHQIAKTKTKIQPRINLTFRNIIS